MLRLILICSLLHASLSQYNGIAKRRDQPSLHHYSLQQPHLNQQHHHPSPPQHHPTNQQQQHHPTNQQQQLTNQQQQHHHPLQLQLLSTPQQHQPPSPQPKREPTHYQYSSFGSQSDSTESAPVSIGPFTRNPHVSFQNNNRLDDRNYGPRDYDAGQRNYRYQEGFRSSVGGESFGKPWRPEGRPRRPRKEGGRPRGNMLYDGKGAYREPPKPRGPRIVKYIADKNGFAVREDLVKPLKDLERRQESRRRVVTAAGPAHLMSQVVTSAIRVTGQQQQGGEGKFLPQVFDLKLGGGSKRRREYVL